MLRGLWPCFCFLLSENSSHTPWQQSLPKHRQTKGNQPAHHWKERSETRMPTGEPKDTPRHGFCLAHVHVHRCDLLLYLFIFLFRELSPFSFLVRLPQVLPFLSSLSFSRSLQPSVSPSTGNDATRGIPCVLSDIRVCMCLGCSGTEVILTTACTQSPSLLCGQALISSVHLSGFRGTPTGLHSNTLPRSTSGLPQNEDNALSSCWAFLFRIGRQWKGGLLIPIKHNNRRPRLSLPLSAPPPQHTEKSWETARIHKSKIPSPHSYPWANRNRKIWAISRLPCFPYLCQCPKLQISPFFLYCNILER